MEASVRTAVVYDERLCRLGVGLTAADAERSPLDEDLLVRLGMHCREMLGDSFPLPVDESCVCVVEAVAVTPNPVTVADLVTGGGYFSITFQKDGKPLLSTSARELKPTLESLQREKARYRIANSVLAAVRASEATATAQCHALERQLMAFEDVDARQSQPPSQPLAEALARVAELEALLQTERLLSKERAARAGAREAELVRALTLVERKVEVALRALYGSSSEFNEGDEAVDKEGREGEGQALLFGAIDAVSMLAL